MRGSVQQLHPELPLEQLHLAAERRLRDVQALGSPREVSLPRDRNEVLQPTQIGHRETA